MYEPPLTVNPVDYGAAKAGLLQLVHYQAVMWGPKRVRVNAIVPGTFPPPGGQHDQAAFRAKLAAKNPLGRVGQAHEIAGAVVYLASDASSYVTGSHLVVDGAGLRGEKIEPHDLKSHREHSRPTLRRAALGHAGTRRPPTALWL